jgi:hypothetical protein
MEDFCGERGRVEEEERERDKLQGWGPLVLLVSHHVEGRVSSGG